MKLFNKIVLVVGTVALVGAITGGTAFAANVDVVPDVADNIGLGNASPEDLIVQIINWILGVLALIAVIMILIGGFQWMTAGGNEEKTEKARKLLIAAVIGLVIILAAWGISIYAINNLLDFTTTDAATA